MKIKLFTATKAFITYKNKVLIIRECSEYEDGANISKYDVPGGRVIPGQRFDESLKREINEETGLSVEIKNPFFVNEWLPKVKGEQWQIIGTFFICEASTAQVKIGPDHDDFKWIIPEEYKKYGLIENLFPAFAAYLKNRTLH